MALLKSKVKGCRDPKMMAVNSRMLFTLLFLLQNRANGCKSLVDSNSNIESKELSHLDSSQISQNKLDFSVTKNGAGTIRKQGTDLDLKSIKRPNFSNIEQIKDIFEDSHYESSHRYKRKAPERSLSNLFKRLNEELKKDDLMAADANPRLEPNYTGTPKKMNDDSRFGGINTEQLYNKKNDKIRQLHLQHNEEKLKIVEPALDTDCEFETECTWTWRKDIANGFFVTSGDKLAMNETGPKVDASSNALGNFLLLRLSSPMTSEFLHVTSPLFSPTRNSCRLQVWIYQENMNNAEIRIVGDKTTNHSQSINNHTQWLVERIRGDNSKKWRKYESPIGKMSENFTIILEVVPSQTITQGAVVAFDNIALTHCYPKLDDTCTPHQYRCKSTTNCINNTSICDITQDCLLGDDERQNCDGMPYGSRCTFEEDWCGWYNVEGRILEWTRHNGSTPTNYTGPNYDHTYKNSTGKYLFVNMLKEEASFASSATLRSVIFNPPPRVHGNVSSKYYNSCAIRFYLHQTGKHKSGIQLQVTELKPTDNYSTEILWSFIDYGDKWIRQVFILPNITHKYFIHFDAKRGYRYISDIAIDDVSLSPECFGLNIPPEELNGYNYWNPYDEHVGGRETHKHFVNETSYHITTCNAKGRFGPTERNCAVAYNHTKVKVKVLSEPGLSGVQKWTSPSDGFYTFILVGASGGKGSGAMGSSRGAMVRVVLELRKGQEIYMLIGQEGTSACVKSLGHEGNSSCSSVKNDDRVKGIREFLNMTINDGGGGGGGATFLFLRNKSRQYIPIAVAAGGGGLGLGRFIDTGRQHGQAINMSKPPFTGRMYGKNSAGAGGGWKMFPGIVNVGHKQLMGRALLDGGGIGGRACYNSTDDRGYGGFGGGGGGCRSGGGGGGFAGGDATSTNTTNGEGGYSYIDPSRTVLNLSEAHSGYNAGPGSVLIIPAIPGCDCNYRCVALDSRKSLTACICPKNWKLDSDGKTCITVPENAAGDATSWILIVLIISVIFLTTLVAFICFILYNRYQHQASGILRRKMLSGADLQLDRLRVASDSMMTEYNPNYEFGGVVYTLKDLKDIPREQLRLVKALGQGAFGEVYQGFYRQRPCDTVEMPVAVKTLPEMSTSQAEMDFLMEALIMSKFNHPNIVHFIGVCFDKHPRFIVLELLAGGDLKNFLRESRPKPERGSPLTMKDLVLIAVDVAKGCKYLEDNRFIHRDIAARNCLLTTKGPGRVVKIADFGMSRDVYRSDYYRKGGKAMLPIKWMPPEAFLDGIFTSKTDVWSFGVLLWEIMSMGYMPYTGCANREVMQLVTSGGRLDPPANCPGPIYGIMTQCWHPTPEQRPTFATILERLGYCLQDPQVMNAPLPVFNRPPSNERDATVMRPLSSDENCLQVVPQSSDYLIPNHTNVSNPIGSSSSVEKLLPENSDSWETSFIMPQSRSTQPLLLECEQKEEEGASSMDKLVAIDSLSNSMVGNHNNNMKDMNSLKSGISLDAGALAKQSLTPNKYSNLLTGDAVTGNGVLQNGPVSQNNYLNANASKFLNETEINC
ncbi:tyrosine-protein kinase receptor isoform X2 [Tribolium castaneum]|uniref:tyrosine-protein kinase receptor isoform X2 n=1 Tax=Tribolium castaneum TaxID=7070 RepID=UPI00046C28CC|nr:PREDICTED: ALK tyrosine kinase receptor isoform X2 [Tribolium castaneum]|eukprot:XP_008194070.1 PREDICTED: ALK tyrosine kinase receptor isoform X2 [Tribolium castaneum]